MFKLFGVTLVLAAALIALAGPAAAQERAIGVSIEKVLAAYLRQVEEGAIDQAPQLKAVPRADKAEATIVGTVLFVSESEVLPEGTPFRIVAVRSQKPFTHDVVLVCLGEPFNTSCGRLAVGRRVSFTSNIVAMLDILASFDEECSDELCAVSTVLVVKRLQT